MLWIHFWGSCVFSFILCHSSAQSKQNICLESGPFTSSISILKDHLHARFHSAFLPWRSRPRDTPMSHSSAILDTKVCSQPTKTHTKIGCVNDHWDRTRASTLFSSFEHQKNLLIMGPNNTKNSSKSVIFSYLKY